jgi:hypothetical protein
MATKKKAAKKPGKKKAGAKRLPNLTADRLRVFRFDPDWIIDRGPQIDLSAVARRQIAQLRKEFADRVTQIVRKG